MTSSLLASRSSSVVSTALRGALCALLAASGLVGCGQAEPEPQDTPAPPFPEGTGQQAEATADYPAGPYGIGFGSVIEDFEFMGYPQPMVDNETLVRISLSDFYNPTGDGVYPEGSPFGAGNPKPKALHIVIGSVWCPPCNQEADQILPVEYAKYKPEGAEFLSQLADGPTYGKPATDNHLTSWTNKYDVDYPSVIDPAGKLEALWEADAFPQNMIIDPRDMTVKRVIAGVPDASYWTKFESVLAGN